MTIEQMLKLIENDLREKNPNYDIGQVYAGMYGTLSAWITKEQVIEICRLKKIAVD
jgi:hypothetical protein